MFEQEIIMQKYSKIIKAIQKNSRRKKIQGLREKEGRFPYFASFDEETWNR